MDEDAAFAAFIGTVLLLIGMAMFFSYQLADRKLDILDKHGCTTVLVNE
jgi:hypothetical protein